MKKWGHLDAHGSAELGRPRVELFWLKMVVFNKDHHHRTVCVHTTARLSSKLT